MDKQTFEITLERLLSESRAAIPEALLPDKPYRGTTDPGWYDFELTLWAKGEEIRKLLTASRRTLTPEQTASVIAICQEPNAKRGRQSFLLLLGRKVYACHAHAVAELLSDSHVAGQAIETLYKMGASGYCREIEPFLAHDKTWIRNSAIRYLKKFQ